MKIILLVVLSILISGCVSTVENYQNSCETGKATACTELGVLYLKGEKFKQYMTSLMVISLADVILKKIWVKLIIL